MHADLTHNPRKTRPLIQDESSFLSAALQRSHTHTPAQLLVAKEGDMFRGPDMNLQGKPPAVTEEEPPRSPEASGERGSRGAKGPARAAGLPSQAREGHMGNLPAATPEASAREQHCGGGGARRHCFLIEQDREVLRCCFSADPTTNQAEEGARGDPKPPGEGLWGRESVGRLIL